MSAELYLAFVAASILLILTPGPMVAFVVATTLSRGLPHGFAAVAGSLIASGIHIGVVALGLAALMTSAASAFFWIKWAGVAYLTYLALRAFRAPADPLEPETAVQSGGWWRSYFEGFLVNLTNPKGLLFHGAFLPLFISPDAPVGPQFLLLGGTFLIVGASFDSLWALTAARSRPVLMRLGRLRHRITGGVLLTAAAGLALVRK
ncbi:LysE family translocator [Hyphococcus formosus]|uniref:LysE family translocator n=1 Tax=Hyphococcus formosus TaxID=3143534 RepID=UPI00398B099B